MSAGEIIALVGGILGILTAIITVATFVSNRKKDGYSEGDQDGTLKGDVKYICRGIDDLRLDVKDLSRKQQDQNERLIRVEESCKQAHKRIDEIKTTKQTTGRKKKDDT